MKNNSLSRLGGICAILVGISYIVVGIAYPLVPVEQKPGADPATFLLSFAQNSTMSMLTDGALAIGAVLALAVVLAISEKVRSVNEGWACWMSTLAIVGFAVMALNYFRFLALNPASAAAYVKGDAATKAAIAAHLPALALDPQRVLTFGGVGLWSLAVNLLALRGNIWPKPLAYVGIVGAIAYLFAMAGFALRVETLIAIAAVAAVIVAPIWYIWLGLLLRRASP